MSISPELFLKHLLDNDINFFTGVPDSLLKYFCLCIDNNEDIKDNHIITANEGSAIALASGYHLGTKKIPLVYMQNSGIGNAINPLLSLTDTEVYSIPMLILIGWRGEPGVKDEPQHVKQGRIQLALLESMELPYGIISSNDKNFKPIVDKAIEKARTNESPYILLVKKNTFKKFDSTVEVNRDKINSLKREQVLNKIIEKIPKDSIIVSTTGKTSRELFEIRVKNNSSHSNDLLTIGSMGHCSSIALGIAKSNPMLDVFCIDGDGAMIMHMGALSNIGQERPKNLKHILINNFAHESVGGQSTASNVIDYCKLSEAISYKAYYLAKDSESLELLIEKLVKEKNNPSFFEIQVQSGSRSDLGRPTKTPKQNKIDLINKINELSKK